MQSTLYFSVLAMTIFSCTMANSKAVKEQEDSNNVNYSNMSIGDTLIFTPKFIATNSFVNEEGTNARKVTVRNHSLLAKVIASGSGKIYVDVCVNQAGEPVFVSIDKERTTITNKETLANALNMIARYRFEADETAVLYECGIIKLFLDINSFR